MIRFAAMGRHHLELDCPRDHVYVGHRGGMLDRYGRLTR